MANYRNALGKPILTTVKLLRKVRRKTTVTWIALAFYVSGIIAAIDAVMTTRTAPDAAELLINGNDTFDNILAGIGQGLTLLLSAVILFLLIDKSPLLTGIMVSLDRAILVTLPASIAAIVVDSFSK